MGSFDTVWFLALKKPSIRRMALLTARLLENEIAILRVYCNILAAPHNLLNAYPIFVCNGVKQYNT